jgi:hypothetical protein
MAKKKYSKYILNELTQEEREQGMGGRGFIVFADDDIIKGCNYFSVRLMGESATKIAGHGPHIHKDVEILAALGTDPDNPKDLGATIEICMGPELESHIITESTIIYIPPNFIHCPYRVLEVKRPFLFVHSQMAPKMTEKPYKMLVPPEMRDKYIFINAGYDEDE